MVLKSIPRTRSTMICAVPPIPEAPSSVPRSSTRARSGPMPSSIMVKESLPRRVIVTGMGSVSPNGNMAVV